MTTSVADKTPISYEVRRRHHDPPLLWIAVAIGSVSLHLLVFWLMRSPNVFRPWFPQQSQAIVPIELVDISPQASTTKPQAPATTPKAAPPTSTSQDDQSVNISDPVEQENRTDTSQPNTQVFGEETSPQAQTTVTPTPEPTPPTPQPEPETTVTPTPEPTPPTQPKPETTATPTPAPTPPTPTPTPTVPASELPWNRRQDIELGQGTPLPSNIPSVTPEQITESEAVEEKTPRTLQEETANGSSADTPTTANGETTGNSSDDGSHVGGDIANSSSPETPSTPNGETASNSSDNSSSNPETPNTPAAVGASIATVLPIAETEVRQLIQEGKIGDKDLPDVFAVYQGSPTKTIDSSYLPSNATLEPAKLLASLVVDQNGNFQQAKVLELPANLQSQTSLYEQLISELFKNETCSPAQNRDGRPIDLSNCYVWIEIKPANAN